MQGKDRTFNRKPTPLKAPPPAQARGGDYFPNTVLLSHTGESLRLYDDLVRGKVVTLNFMSIRAERHFPVSGHLARVAKRLGTRLGREVVMISITTDPATDSPARLKAFAEAIGAPPGWYFLTTTPKDVEAVSRRLYHHHHAGHHGHPTRLVHYGNAAIGVWGAFPADADTDLTLERLSWLQPRRRPVGDARRAGPRRLGGDFTRRNRDLA